MRCPFCRHPNTRVSDSRVHEDGATIRRRRACTDCGRRFSTVEAASLSIVKRSGATEPFSRDKVLAGVRRACQGRPVSEDDLALLAHQVEETVRQSGVAEIGSQEVGIAVLRPLRELDLVAYLRFASVYKGFESLSDFESEIAGLRAERAAAGGRDRESEVQPARGAEPPGDAQPPLTGGVVRSNGVAASSRGGEYPTAPA